MTTTVATTAAPAAPANGAPRNTAGQFAPRDGNANAAESAAAPPAQGQQTQAGPPAIDWSLEGEVEVYGEKQKVSWRSKEEALAEARELRARRKRDREDSALRAQAQALLKASPEELFRLRGEDPEDYLRKRVIAAAQRLDMTPEQQRIADLEAEVGRRDAAQKAQADERAAQEEQQRKAARRSQVVAGLDKGLELSGLPKTHATMALLAEIQQEAASTGLGELPPELLAAEANKRYSERGIEPLKKLQGKSLLDRLGADVVRAVLLAERERRGGVVVQSRQQRAPDLHEPVDQSKALSEADVDAALRALRNGTRR